MATWSEFQADAPELARSVQTLFDAHRHKFLATIRKDGGPRISGIETDFSDGELWLGMMGGSRKALDLRRDPRLALHSASMDPPAEAGVWPGDAKIMGRAVEMPSKLAEAKTGYPGSHLFRVEIDEVVLNHLARDHMVIELWRPGQGIKRFERR
jgi:hypothetical protein